MGLAVFKFFSSTVEDKAKWIFDKLKDWVSSLPPAQGLERMERPATYKQWKIRHQRAGFKQLPLNQDMMKRS
ncbi:hypothetical protein GUJ93_ZPchr0011g27959 [Zizania palustris]|uniref:Uncharacterized protein n=1 Tax=Zizania palustris TaxID=103762 RepID=A0A8J5WL89_ZIZPA|nr:hypothetical protein GUJ93_ZPchr0011g27959 [Zizania palustris]